MSELLPCPFCGEKPSLTFPCEADHMWTISCSYCCMELASVSKEEAVERWNTRHYPAEVQQAVERMKPMKVINKWSQHGIEYGDCPACICPVENKEWNDHPHCERCGQALDWS